MAPNETTSTAPSDAAGIDSPGVSLNVKPEPVANETQHPSTEAAAQMSEHDLAVQILRRYLLKPARDLTENQRQCEQECRGQRDRNRQGSSKKNYNAKKRNRQRFHGKQAAGKTDGQNAGPKQTGNQHPRGTKMRGAHRQLQRDQPVPMNHSPPVQSAERHLEVLQISNGSGQAKSTHHEEPKPASTHHQTVPRLVSSSGSSADDDLGQWVPAFNPLIPPPGFGQQFNSFNGDCATQGAVSAGPVDRVVGPPPTAPANVDSGHADATSMSLLNPDAPVFTPTSRSPQTSVSPAQADGYPQFLTSTEMGLTDGAAHAGFLDTSPFPLANVGISQASSFSPEANEGPEQTNEFPQSLVSTGMAHTEMIPYNTGCSYTSPIDLTTAGICQANDYSYPTSIAQDNGSLAYANTLDGRPADSGAGYAYGFPHITGVVYKQGDDGFWYPGGVFFLISKPQFEATVDTAQPPMVYVAPQPPLQQ